MSTYTYPRHRDQHWQANRPTDCPYCRREIDAAFNTIVANEAVTRYEAAAMTASARRPLLADRAITWAARIILALILAWIFTTDDQALTWVHVIAGIAAIPLAHFAMPLPDQEGR